MRMSHGLTQGSLIWPIKMKDFITAEGVDFEKPAPISPSLLVLLIYVMMYYIILCGLGM